MTRCTRCRERASVRIAGETVCWSHYNQLLKTGAKGERLK
jgi:hypothetical protein